MGEVNEVKGIVGSLSMFLPMMLMSEKSQDFIVIGIVMYVLNHIFSNRTKIWNYLFNRKNVYEYVVSSRTNTGYTNDFYTFIVRYLEECVDPDKIKSRIITDIEDHWDWTGNERNYKSFTPEIDIPSLHCPKIKIGDHEYGIFKENREIFMKFKKESKLSNTPCIVFQHENRDALKSITDLVHKKYEEYVIELNNKNVEYLRYFNYDAKEKKWNGSKLVNNKTFKNVILKKKDYDQIKGSIESFDKTEEEYKKYGIPYKLGLLFYGPPGTGKTSAIYAISNVYKRDIYFASTELIMQGLPDNVLKEIKPKSIFVFEDLDLMIGKVKRLDSEKEKKEGSNGGGKKEGSNGGGEPSKKRKKKKKKKDVDVIGVLKEDFMNYILKRLFEVFDGYRNLHGVIVIITTNFIDKFDKGLFRSGRIDHKIKFDHCDEQQYMDIYKLFEISDKMIPKIKPYEKPSSDIMLEAFELKKFNI